MRDMGDGLFDIHIIKRYLHAAQLFVGEHLSFARQQPQLVHLRKFRDDSVGDIE